MYTSPDGVNIYRTHLLSAPAVSMGPSSTPHPSRHSPSPECLTTSMHSIRCRSLQYIRPRIADKLSPLELAPEQLRPTGPFMRNLRLAFASIHPAMPRRARAASAASLAARARGQLLHVRMALAVMALEQQAELEEAEEQLAVAAAGGAGPGVMADSAADMVRRPSGMVRSGNSKVGKSQVGEEGNSRALCGAPAVLQLLLPPSQTSLVAVCTTIIGSVLLACTKLPTACPPAVQPVLAAPDAQRPPGTVPGLQVGSGQTQRTQGKRNSVGAWPSQRPSAGPLNPLHPLLVCTLCPSNP